MALCNSYHTESEYEPYVPASEKSILENENGGRRVPSLAVRTIAFSNIDRSIAKVESTCTAAIRELEDRNGRVTYYSCYWER